MMTEPPRSGGHDSVYVHHVPTHGNNSHPTCNSSETNAALLSGPAGSSGGGKGSRKKAVALYCFCRRPDNLGKMVRCGPQLKSNELSRYQNIVQNYIRSCCRRFVRLCSHSIAHTCISIQSGGLRRRKLQGGMVSLRLRGVSCGASRRLVLPGVPPRSF
jgi:hypothetical protein